MQAASAVKRWCLIHTQFTFEAIKYSFLLIIRILVLSKTSESHYFQTVLV